jgi:hypothetical protein
MKKELFSGVEPYTNLVIAIKDDMPSIINDNYHPDLLQLARDMLQKEWENRLIATPITKIKGILEKCVLTQKDQENHYSYIKSQAQPIKEQIADILTTERSHAEKEKKMQSIHYKIWNTIDECFNGEEIKEITEKIESTKPFKLDNFPDKKPMMRYKIYKLIGKFAYGFIQEYFILFKVENNESSYCKISVLGIILDLFTKMKLPEASLWVSFTLPSSLRVSLVRKFIIPSGLIPTIEYLRWFQPRQASGY